MKTRTLAIRYVGTVLGLETLSEASVRLRIAVDAGTWRDVETGAHGLIGARVVTADFARTCLTRDPIPFQEISIEFEAALQGEEEP